MSWLRIDDGFADHPKIVALGSDANRWAFLELLTYCARHRTDGYFPAEIQDVRRRLTPRYIALLIDVGLVDRAENGELRVHKWAEYNPGKDPTAAARMQRWRDRHSNGRVTENVTPPETKT